MGLGLLLVSAIAGYWLLTTSNLTRYSAARSSGYHIFFRSSFSGVCLFGLSYLLLSLLYHACPRNEFPWSDLSPDTFTDAVILSFLWGVALPSLFNLFYSNDDGAARAARNAGDAIESLIAESFDERKLVEITLKSGKSYVGLATAIPISTQADADVSLIPYASGYRDRDTQDLRLTVNYAPTLRRVRDKELDLDYSDFRIAIASSEIVSARFFDFEVFRQFQPAPVEFPKEGSC